MRTKIEILHYNGKLIASHTIYTTPVIPAIKAVIKIVRDIFDTHAEMDDWDQINIQIRRTAE